MTTPPSAGTILIVDDDTSVGRVLHALVRQDGINAKHVTSGELALEVLAREAIDVIVTDLRMVGMSGMELLQHVRARWPDIPVIMMTAHGTVDVAVEAMKKGAADFVTKPFERAQILFTIRKALASVAASSSEAPPPVEVPSPGGFVSTSAPMREVRDLLRRAAQGNATVLIRGESGTGKELAARFVHASSPRRAGPFVALHCAALPDALLESELFGYEKGAFTGATVRKPGRVELAQGGTLFLDEIGELTPTMQVKLLRVLQEKEFERLGGTQTLKADVRFVAATHRPLEDLVARGEFREDLFYRLNVVPAWMPPLRARLDDIDALAQHFCVALGAANGRIDASLDADALAALREQPWRGNVRQLQNFIERLVVLSPASRLTRADVERELARHPAFETSSRPSAPAVAASTPPPAPSVPPGANGARKTLDEQRRETEREALITALQRANDNRTVAARILGVSRRTLYNKLEEYGLS